MRSPLIPLPYFDHILARLEAGDPLVSAAFGRHVHWGCWADPRAADGTVADFAAAAERLALWVARAANVAAGQRVLDVGCGFGGTLAALAERCRGLTLCGLNIDRRQLHRARQLLPPDTALVAGDACRLPFADASFDAVLCVEAIFHFPERQRFFQEARRVLRPRGWLALSDFVPRLVVPLLWDFFEARFKPKAVRLYGPSDMRCTVSDYRRLARRAGFEPLRVRDVTANTLPSYAVLRPLVARMAPHLPEAEEVIRRVERTSRLGLLRYVIISCQAPVT
ncbi:MAG TPA: methyltransferase domain-containing protein [Gemmataceae bacterium]|nr:methyltransferase domain-containing protein [Gemmataceae bacterium]